MDVGLEFNRGLGIGVTHQPVDLFLYVHNTLEMDSFLLSRELGDPQAFPSLELGYNTRLIHSVERATGIIFCQPHRTGINALDIERQTSR